MTTDHEAGVAPDLGAFPKALIWTRREIVRAWPLLAIFACVIAANSPELLHLVTSNPLRLDAGLASPSTQWLPGVPVIDPNAGFTSQALGHLAAVNWLHLHVPWWNPYEGVGAPLAGEMQSGAFFPASLLLLFSWGPVAEQIVLELVAGWSTYWLLRHLQVVRLISMAGGTAFGLCGTFAWLAHAPDRSAAMLPLCLVGVERLRAAVLTGRRGGWKILAVALTLSILGGFPETTLLDGVLVAIWTILRVPSRKRELWWPAIRKLLAGILVGVGLATPLIVAFADYLPSSNSGGHTGFPRQIGAARTAAGSSRASWGTS